VTNDLSLRTGYVLRILRGQFPADTSLSASRTFNTSNDVLGDPISPQACLCTRRNIIESSPRNEEHVLDGAGDIIRVEASIAVRPFR
jgi:hypothetical protein